MSGKDGFFSQKERGQIVRAISAWHAVTTGEIRVYVDKTSGNDVIGRANEIYEFLDLHKLPDRNGALLYIAAEDGILLVLGGAGINRKVLAGFWDRIRNRVEKSFLAGEYLEGALIFIDKAEIVLRKHFPEKKKVEPADVEKFNPVEAPDLSPAEEYRQKIQRLKKRNARRLIKQWYSLSKGHGRHSARYQQEHTLFSVSLYGLCIPILAYVMMMICIALINETDKRKIERTKEIKSSLYVSIAGSILWTCIFILVF